MADGAAVPLHHGLGYRVREFFRRLWQKSVEDDVFFMAGAIAFNVLVALVPLLILGIGLTGYVLSARFGNPTNAVLSLLGDNLPLAGDGLAVTEALSGPVAALVDQRTGFTVLGAVFFLWLSTRLVASLRIALREIFDIGLGAPSLQVRLPTGVRVAVDVSLDPTNPRMKAEDVELIRKAFHLDEPMHVQYAYWIRDLFTGELKSFKVGEAVLDKIVFPCYE